jgi:hypothetical protein
VSAVSPVLALPFVTAIACQLLSQAFKVVYYSIAERRPAFERFVHAGGIPSAHTAFVSALTTSIALRSGVGSDLFSVSLVFSLIVVYDSFRLRGNVQRHAETLNAIRDRIPDAFEELGPRLTETIGHSIAEVIAGIVWGVGFALVVQYIR